jgi:pimeloyl-ACP methyl ester carboxylesterase
MDYRGGAESWFDESVRGWPSVTCLTPFRESIRAAPMPEKVAEGRSMEHVTSADGTKVALALTGSGPPLVVVNGALSVGTPSNPLGPLLEPRFTLVRYDRRGRGASGDAPSYAPEREIEDLAAVLGAVSEPGSAFVFAHSGGAILALEAVMRGLAVRRLAVNEPPYIVEGTRDRPPIEIVDRLRALIAAGDREEALRTFFVDQVGLPEAAVGQMRASPAWPGMLAIAHTTAYDSALTVHSEVPADRLAKLRLPVLVLTGSASYPWIGETARQVADAVPGAELVTLAGQPHSPAPEVLAPELTRFFLA